MIRRLRGSMLERKHAGLKDSGFSQKQGKNSIISKDSLALLDKFRSELEMKGLAKNTINTYCFYMEWFADYIKGINLEDFNSLDVAKQFIYSRNNGEPDWNTINLAMISIRHFYRILNNGELPEWLKSLKVPKKKKKLFIYGPNDMWTQEEVIEAIKVLDHPRDKALVALLYDLALRPHEALKLKIGDIRWYENYAELQVSPDTKTGQGGGWITFSYPYLLQWYNSHPLKDNMNAPFFIRLQEGAPRALKYSGLYSIFADKLKPKLQHIIKKPFNPYCVCRHSRITELAPVLSDQNLKKLARWKPSSNRLSTYVHLGIKDLKEPLLKHAGIIQEVQEKPKKVNICPKCQLINAPETKLCIKCGYVLSREVYEELRQKEAEKESELNEVRKSLAEIHKWKNEVDAKQRRIFEHLPEILKKEYGIDITAEQASALLEKTSDEVEVERIREAIRSGKIKSIKELFE